MGKLLNNYYFMFAKDLISTKIIPLKLSDTGAEALSIMNDFYIKQLPVVENKKLVGIISEGDLLEYGFDNEINAINFKSKPLVFIKTDDHIYEAMRILAEYDVNIIPVINSKNNYVGLITQEDLISYFAKTGSFNEPGSIVVLEVNKRDYSLSNISHIIESEDAAVLSSYITTDLETHKINVTLKINRQNTQDIIASLKRHNYEVKAFFDESEYLDILKERYDALINFLNV